jgi:hypothetical protein
MSASIDVHNVTAIDLRGVHEHPNTAYRVLEIQTRDGLTIQINLFAHEGDPENLNLTFK